MPAQTVAIAKTNFFIFNPQRMQQLKKLPDGFNQVPKSTLM
jgi:hypothetical protein